VRGVQGPLNILATAGSPTIAELEQSHFAVPLLDVAILAVHHKQESHGGLIGPLEHLSQQSLPSFSGFLGVAVGYAVLDHNKIGPTSEQIPLDPQCPVIRASGPDPHIVRCAPASIWSP